MMNPTAVWSEPLNEQLCTATVTSTHATGASTSASHPSRSSVLATRVYRRNPASGAVDTKTQIRSGMRNKKLKKMAELQGTSTVINRPSHRYELRKTCKRIEAELKVLHSQSSVDCMFLGKKQKLRNNKKLIEPRSQPGRSPELCMNNQENCLHSQMNCAAGASTSTPKTSRSQIVGASTRVYRRNPASGAIHKKRPRGGLSKLELKKIAELQSIINVIIPKDNRNALYRRIIEHCRVSTAANGSRPSTMPPYYLWEQKINFHNQFEEFRLNRARRNGCVRKSLPNRLCG